MSTPGESQPATVDCSTEDGAVVLRLAGRLDNRGAGDVWERALDMADAAAGTTLVVDGRSIDYCDGAGVVLLSELERRQRAAGGSYRLEGLAEDPARLLAKVTPTRGLCVWETLSAWPRRPASRRFRSSS